MTATVEEVACLDQQENSSLSSPQKDQMAQTTFSSKTKQRNASPDPDALVFSDDVRAQPLQGGYGAHKVPSSVESQAKVVDMPVWMTNSSSKQHSPSQNRLKWCGCLASSQCSHFSESYVPDTAITSPRWMPLPFFVPDGSQQLHQQGMKNASSKRENIQEPFHFDVRQIAKFKVQILSHPMFERLLATHVDSLRVATPIDHLETIEAQIATMHHISARYSMLGHNAPLVGEEKDELDRFMASYTMLLESFKERLQEHVRVEAMEAVVSCWELEQALISLTGVAPGEGSGATMSDDDEDRIAEAGASFYDLERGDDLGLGSLIPTESERSLMERVRQDLKSELKQGYRNRIVDVREEILRKRRAGKLPSETTSILKRWWNAHSKWPYPTEDEKARLVQETGLELKQINNWFINQRKRNWHSHSTTTQTSFEKSDPYRSVVGVQASNISLNLGCNGDMLAVEAQEKNFQDVAAVREPL